MPGKVVLVNFGMTNHSQSVTNVGESPVTEMVQTNPTAPLGAMSFAELREQASAIVTSASLEKDKSRLMGIPHAITRITYRPGISENGVQKDYVSIEAVVADGATLVNEVERGRVPNVNTVDQLTVEANEVVVYNDGSTGVRRQLTHILHNLGLLTVPNVGQDLAVFDTPYFEWDMIGQVGLMNGDAPDEKIEIPDFTVAPNGGQLVIMVPKGLRRSTFPNPANPKDTSEVFYLS